MKKYFFFALMAAAILAGCDKNSKTDPKSEPTDNGERDYVVRIYVTPDAIEYINNDIYLTLPGEEEVKLNLGNPMDLDESADLIALYSINNNGWSSSFFKVYGLTFKGTKGKATLRYDYSVKSDVTLPEKIDFGYGYYIGGFMPGTNNTKGNSCDVFYNKGLKKENVEKHLTRINALEYSVEIQ